MISKELLQQVVKNLTVKEIVSTDNNKIDNNIYYNVEEIGILQAINIYELMGKVKEWALDNDCTIMSFIDFDGTAFANIFSLITQQKVSFQGEKEYDAVFKAGQLILMEMTNDK